jgi:hypothetical protein
MRNLLQALVIVAGVALFVWLVANPIADVVARTRLERLKLEIVADTDLPAVATEAGAAGDEIVKALEVSGVRVTKESADARRPMEMVLTVHAYARCGGKGAGAEDVLEDAELSLYDPSGAGAAPQWSRATPLAIVPPGAPLPIRKQVRALADQFIAEHHLPARPAVPENPRHIGWR